jgi:hypothetical protein
MNGDDCSRPRSYFSGDIRRVQAQGIRINVGKDRDRADSNNRRGRGDECVGRHNHLIAGHDTDSSQAHLEGGGTVGASNGVFRALEGRECSLELLDLLAIPPLARM